MDSSNYSYSPVIVEEKIVVPQNGQDVFVEKEVRPLPSYPEIDLPPRSFSPEIVAVSYQNSQYPGASATMNSFPPQRQSQNSFYYYQASSQKPISVSGDDESCCLRMKMACTMVFAIIFIVVFLLVSVCFSGGIALSAAVLNANPFWLSYGSAEQSVGQNVFTYYVPSYTNYAEYVRIDLPKSSASTTYNSFSVCYSTTGSSAPFSVLGVNSYLPFLDDQSYNNGLAQAIPNCNYGSLDFQICEYSSPHVWVQFQDLSSGQYANYFSLHTTFRTSYSQYCDYSALDYSRFTLFIFTIVAICLGVLLCCFCSTCCCCFCRYQSKLLKYHETYTPVH